MSLMTLSVMADLLGALTLMGLLSSVASAITQPIHKHMTEEELSFLFGCQEEQDVPDYEIVPLPSDNPLLYHFNFTVFGKPLSLQMKPNDRLLSRLKVLVRDEGDSKEVGNPVSNCHYLHRDASVTAAFSSCGDYGLHGWIFLEDDTLEVRPLTPRLHTLLEHRRDSPLVPYLVKRAPPINVDWTDELYLPQDVIEDTKDNSFIDSEALEEVFERPVRSGKRPVVEVALFFDEAGYRIFAPYMQNDDKQMRDMLLAYLNGVQALYHHPSVGQPVDIALVRLEIFKSQPPDLPHYGGERSALLDSFCAYNAKHNPPGDSDPDHWDMGLYVSGLDFYAIEGGRRSDITMGLATVGGVCMDKYACLIAELGTTNSLGKPYPSAGFTSVYILAHEMGHNLGMHHDSSSNSCPSEGFIMSPSRGTNGETLWSTCSAQVMQKLSEKKCLEDSPGSIPAERNHNRMHDHPGQLWGAKRQCEVLLRDKDAELQDSAKTEDMCQSLICKTPHRSGYYFAGPALEGTACASGKWCQGGECVKQDKSSEKVVKGGWSKWTTEECASGCIAKSKGFHTKHRKCDSPSPVNTEEGCEGPSFDVALCKDDKICKKMKRINPADYARKKCVEFSKTLSILDPKGSGLQAPHEEGRLWVACSIFCRRKDNGSYYSPRLDLNDLGSDPYFPDGTWCHHNGKHNYYCMNHHCRPENFQGAKSVLDISDNDLAMPQNASPRPMPLPDLILRYLSLDPEGRPLLTTITPEDARHGTLESDWSSKDYLDLPQPM